MTAGQDGLDPAKMMRDHARSHWCTPDPAKAAVWVNAPDQGCLPYRLAALALDLQGKVARIWSEGYDAGGDDEVYRRRYGHTKNPYLADPTPAALCPKVSPLEALTDRTCKEPAGHAGPCLFAGHDGRTDLEVMPK